MINPIEYFLDPLKEGYTFEKTLILAIIFVISVFLIYKLLKRLKVKINKNFAIAIFFYVLFGSSLRVLVDLNIINSILFVTPNIYIFVGVITIVSLIINQVLKIKNYSLFILVGIFLYSISFTILFPHLKNLNGLLLTFLNLIPGIIVLRFLSVSRENKITIFSQYFDGTVAYVSIKYFSDKLYEQHLLANLIFSIYPELFPIIKFLVTMFIVLYIDKLKFDSFLTNYIKLIISILGFATSIRSFLLLLSI